MRKIRHHLFMKMRGKIPHRTHQYETLTLDISAEVSSLLHSESNLNGSIHNKQFFSYSKHWTDSDFKYTGLFEKKRETCKRQTWAETLGFGIKHWKVRAFFVLWSLTKCNPALFCVWATCEVRGRCLAHMQCQVQMTNAKESVLRCIGLFPVAAQLFERL